MPARALHLPIVDDDANTPPKVRLPLLETMLREQSDLTAVERFSQRHDDATTPLHEPFYRELLPASPPGEGQQYAFSVDLDACSGCKACVVACHSLNGLDETETWRTVGVLHGGTPEEPVQKTVTSACHHCVDPGCMKGCPVGAYEKDPDTGIVRHLDDQCIGCQYCIFTCPYEVPKFNAEKGIVRKCDMCADRLAEGEAPACVQACPSQAISITVVDTRDAVADAQADVFLPGTPSPGITVPTTIYKSKEPLPRNALPADFHSVNPAHVHTPLVWMLVLTQLSVGAFCVGELFDALIPGDALSPIRQWHGLLALGLGLVALAASTAHLGRPQYAFRAILGIRTSWLSREILAFGAFAGAATVYAGALWQADHEPLIASLPWLQDGARAALPYLGTIVSVTGLAGVLCSVMLYHATGRRFWNASYTGVKFLMTSAVLGLAFSTAFAAVIALLVADEPASVMAPWFEFSAKALAVATVLALVGELSVLTHLRDRQRGDLWRTAALLVGELRPLSGVRLATAVIGGAILPLVFLASSEGVPFHFQIAAVVASALLLAAGALIERTLFFAAVSAPRMPGRPGGTP